MKQLKNYIHRGIFFAFAALLILGQACKSKKTEKAMYCTMDDFKKMDKIDIHCHVNTESKVFMKQAVNDNFRILTINTDAGKNFDLKKQQNVANFHRKEFLGQIEYLTTFSMKNWGDENWIKQTINHIEKSIKRGAIGVKIWKNIGMLERKKDGSFIMIDDPGFDPLFDYLEKNDIVVCAHLGEPKNCWLPVEQMTVNNDISYFTKHPQYHMYLYKEYPSYEDQITARNNRLEKHPTLRFMGAHLASLEWDVDEIARFFDRFPNANVDMAERICHLQVQAQKDLEKVYDFFIKYQNRIIYGTDMGDYREEKDADKLRAKTHDTWINDWEFLTTDQLIKNEFVKGQFKGLRLPKQVIEKIYFKNAEKMFSEMKR